MPPTGSFLFPPFRLDAADARLWQGGQVVVVRRKTLAVLRYLVEHADQLVTKEELVAAAWPDIVVSGGLLSECISELRKVLGDDPKTPGFVETVHGLGYRFIAPVTTTQPVESRKVGKSESQKPQSQTLQSLIHYPQSAISLVGRDAELEQLQNWLEKALHGERQIVFVTGEPGIGKTTLVEVFLEQAAAAKQLWIGRGQCIEHYSASEAYLPVLEALGRLCREPEGERLMAILSQRAPTWLLQIPDLLSAAELEVVQRRTMGATQERMLREMAQAIEELTAVQPLVLWLEDLHGSDYATLDLLAFLARRRELARLLVLGTYRPLVVRTGEHPLYTIQRELQVRGQCHELTLEPLGGGAVAEYLETRLPGKQLPAGLAHVIHQRTEGNPLFIVNVVETLLKQQEESPGNEPRGLQGIIEQVSRTVPASIRQFIEQQVEYLKPEEQQLLEAASVAGVECSAAALAAGLGEEGEEIEQRGANLARRGQFVRTSGIEEWPDGTMTTRYHFVHALYQEVLYDRLAVARRIGLHRRIGERVEKGYRLRAGEMAAELAMHFERGRDAGRAVQYLQIAGETSMQRHAYREALALFTKGVALLQLLPETPERLHQELALYIALGPVLSMTRGYADPEVERVYMRARELCQRVGDTPQLFPVLQGLWLFSFMRAEHQTAHELGEQSLRLAQSVHDSALLVEAHLALGLTLHFLGELAAAQEHGEQGTALYDPQQHYSLALLYAHDPGVACLALTAWVLWFRGYPDQALVRADEALTLARKLSHPYSLGVALFSGAILSQHCLRQEPTAQPWTEEAVALCTEQGFPFFLALGLILQGAVLARQGQHAAGIEQLRQGMEAFRATGAELLRPYFLALLAKAYGAGGQAEEGLAVLIEALGTVDKTGERFYEAELWRLKGQLTLQSQTSLRQVPGKSKTRQDKSESRRSKSRKVKSLKSTVRNP